MDDVHAICCAVRRTVAEAIVAVTTAGRDDLMPEAHDLRLHYLNAARDPDLLRAVRGRALELNARLKN